MLIVDLFYNNFIEGYLFLVESNSILIILFILTLLNLHILFTWFYVLDDFFNQLKWFKKLFKFKINIMDILLKIFNLILFFVSFMQDIGIYSVLKKFYKSIISLLKLKFIYFIFIKFNLLLFKKYSNKIYLSNYKFILFNKSDTITNIFNSKVFINNFDSILFW